MKAATIGLWLLVVGVGYGIGNWHQDLFYRAGPLARPKQGPAVLLDAFGEGKTLLARYLYFKAEIYHEVLDLQGVPHAKQKDAMPLLRMVTYLDPSLTETFDIIAWDLWKGWGEEKQALDLLEEAITYNPSSHLLWFRHAFIHFQSGRDVEALASADKASEFAGDEFEKLNANRLKFWAAKRAKIEIIPDKVQKQHEAIEVLYGLRKTDILWIREKERVDKLLKGSS